MLRYHFCYNNKKLTNTKQKGKKVAIVKKSYFRRNHIITKEKYAQKNA
ncbi:MAG: hypothetical protein JWP44_2997 [Mucilaginibacter sp.]|nr:hypothetical protein [Mucilaginibacter sp.]